MRSCRDGFRGALLARRGQALRAVWRLSGGLDANVPRPFVARHESTCSRKTTASSAVCRGQLRGRLFLGSMCNPIGSFRLGIPLCSFRQGAMSVVLWLGVCGGGYLAVVVACLRENARHVARGKCLEKPTKVPEREACRVHATCPLVRAGFYQRREAVSIRPAGATVPPLTSTTWVAPHGSWRWVLSGVKPRVKSRGFRDSTGTLTNFSSLGISDSRL